MYRLATILLIGSAAALSLKKHETVDMAQVNAGDCVYSVFEGKYEGCSESELDARH